jgi:hypothetical protein
MGNSKQDVAKVEILLPAREFRAVEVWIWLALPVRRSSGLRAFITVIIRVRGFRTGHSESHSFLMAGETQVESRDGQPLWSANCYIPWLG